MSFPGHLHGHGLASHRHRHNSTSSASSFGLSTGNNPADNLHGVGNGHPALNGPTALVDVHDDANDSRMNLGESADHNNTAPNSNHRNVRNLRLMAERRAGLQRWVNSSRARRHPVTRLLKRVALVTSICAPLMVAAWSGYLSVTDRLHEFYKGSLYDFVETHHIRVAGATTESVVATDRSLVAWQSELTRLRSELSKLAGGAVGEVDANNSQLEFETGRDAVGHRSVSTALLAHVLLMITCSLVRNPHIALSCVIMNVLLFRLALQLQQVSDGFGTALDHLDEAHMRFVLSPIGLDEVRADSISPSPLNHEHIALKNLCLHKFLFLKEYWSDQRLGITLGAPIWPHRASLSSHRATSASFAVTLSIPLMLSLLTASTLHCAPQLLRLHPVLETLGTRCKQAMWNLYVNGLIRDESHANSRNGGMRRTSSAGKLPS